MDEYMQRVIDNNKKLPILTLATCVYPDRCTCSSCHVSSYKDWVGCQLWPSQEQFKAMHPEQYITKPKRGPVPVFPKLKLFTFTVKDEHIPSFQLKQQVVHAMTTVYVPQYYIAAMEYGERTQRIHCHVLASFGEYSNDPKNKHLTFKKFNSRWGHFDRAFKLGHIDKKDVDLLSNPSSVKDICAYFDPEMVFFSNEEAEKIYKDMIKEVKETHALQTSFKST